MVRRMTLPAGIAMMLTACGGGGGGSGGTAVTPTPTAATPTPAATTAGACTLRARQDWAAAQLREWYLFPDLLAAGVDPAGYASVDTYIDALTAPARAQRRDRFFTYLTSIREEDAYYASGESAGFGVRFALDAANRLRVLEAFETAPALAAGIDRGATITAIGTSAATARSVADILAGGGGDALTEALGPDSAGTTRYLAFTTADGSQRSATVTKATYALQPVSPRYGTATFTANGARIGYVNLRTFIASAEAPLRAIFAGFQRDGVTQIIVDQRYNGGGLVVTGQLLADLMGRARSSGDVQGYTTYRPEKADRNRTRLYQSEPEAIAPTRIAFIATGRTASASEFVINAARPYFGDQGPATPAGQSRVALVGGNSFGKPVGQIAIDNAACDDRLRVVAFATQNAAREGAYYDGLAGTMATTCAAGDDITLPMGAPGEASTAAAIGFLGGRACARIGAATADAGARAAAEPLRPARPSAAQRDVPGLF